MDEPISHIRARISLAVLVATMLWLRGPVAAQGPGATPEAAAAGLIGALRAGDWDGMAAKMHPAALRELRSFLDPLLELPDAEEFRSTFLGVRSDAEARGLTDAALFARFIRFTMTQDTSMLPAMRTAQLAVLGHVMEGDTAHVVSRLSMTFQGIAVSKMEVSSFQEFNGEWRGLLTGDISGLAKALRDGARQRVQ